MHVLILDDDILLLKGLRRLLPSKRTGMIVTCCSSADIAAEALARGGVDVVIADLMLPGTTGDTFLELARNVSPGVARIAASGHFGRRTVSRVLRVAHRIIQKPYESKVIESICANVSAIINDDKVKAGFVLSTLDLAAYANQCDRSLALTGVPEDDELWLQASLTQMFENPWRCVLAIQAAASPVFGGNQKRVGLAEAIVTLGIAAVRILGRTDRTPDEEPLVNQERLKWLGGQCASSAVLARRIATDLSKLSGAPNPFREIELAHTATLLARVAEPGLSNDRNLDVVVATSAEMLLIRDIDRDVVDTMLAARRSHIAVDASIAAIATNLALVLTANPTFPLLTQEVRWRLRAIDAEDLLIAWRLQAKAGATVLEPAA